MPYVFGYGSLVDRESVESTLGRELSAGDGPHPARLRGYRRAWNIAAHSSVRPDYIFMLEDGTPWEGRLGFLGVETAEGESTLGAVVRLRDDELALLDTREGNYDRIEVGHIVDWEVPDPLAMPIYVYQPRPEVVTATAHDSHAVVVMARYLRLVDRGYRALGADLYAEHLATLPDPAPFQVREISARPADIRASNEAVDVPRDA